MPANSEGVVPKVVYFHGLASVGNSHKSQRLRARFGDDVVVSPDLPVNPDEMLELGHELMRANRQYPVVLTGTSLGGFWAHYFAQIYDASCVLVNPCTDPSESLVKYLGQPVKNYRTGELVAITQQDLDRYAELEQNVPELYNGYLVNLFLARDDDVIAYKQSLNYFEYTRQLTLTSDGGHRYGQHWDQVMDRIAELVKE